MYISITAHKVGGSYSQSSKDFVSYLEKENEEIEPENIEYFFNQFDDQNEPQTVVNEIDNNTAKLKKSEPKFYSIIVSPSKYELKHLERNSGDLKEYTKKIMEDYAKSFNREFNGKSIGIKDIKYFAKIERTRTWKGTDLPVKENQPIASKILRLKNEIRKIKRGTHSGNISKIQRRITKLEERAPHKQDGKRIVQGMKKTGNQSHIHIIVSRKDMTNAISLSPGSKYKASEVLMNGKMVKRGFDRDSFFTKAEKTFDTLFKYNRNYAASYSAKIDFIKNPKLFYTSILGLPANEKALAFKILGKAGLPMASTPSTTAQITLKSIKYMKKAISIAVKSSSIGI